MKHSPLWSLGLVISVTFLAGCSPSRLPRGAQFVGGGLKIEYSPTRDGTVILMERNSGRMVVTESVSEGANFRFYPGLANFEEVLMMMFGQTQTPADGVIVNSISTNTVFELYFVPNRTKNP